MSSEKGVRNVTSKYLEHNKSHQNTNVSVKKDSTFHKKVSPTNIDCTDSTRSTSLDDIKRESCNSRFADYFVICGLDLDSGLEPDLFSEKDSHTHCSPLDGAYKSKTLSHYPENVPWNPFDAHGICMLSLPQGLKFRTQKHNTEPKFHSFATTREDGKRCFGFSLIFYEEVRNKNICNAMHTLQAMFMTELSNGHSTTTLRRIKENDPISRSLPRHFKVASQPEHSASSYYDITKDKLFVAKSISIVCQTPYAIAAEIFLKNVYKCLPRQPGPGLSIESYVYNILYEVMPPSPGKSIRIYLPPDEPQMPPIVMILQRPCLKTELPLLDFPIRLLFLNLGVECTVQLFTSVMLENQVLLRSSDYQKLIIVGECITSLLFPFVWPHVYAPILPIALHHFLDAPVPYIMGLNADCEANLKIGTEASLCYVDIDKKSVQLPEELPTIPHKYHFIEELNGIFEKYNLPCEKPHESIMPSSPHISNRRPSHHGNDNTRSQFDVMTSSCTLPSGVQIRKRLDYYNGLSFNDNNTSELHSLMSGNNEQQSQPNLIRPHDQSPRIVDIIKRKGKKLEDLKIEASDDRMPPAKGKLNDKPKTLQEQYYEDQRLNNSVREIFLNRFVHMFAAYEHFVIHPNQGKDEWISNREILQNFDKASFLSDQPEHHRPFLSRFLESQMFATLIDNKIMSTWEQNADANLQLFDNRITLLRKRHGGENMIRATSYEPCILSLETQRVLEKRLNCVDIEVTPPSEILPNRPAYFRSFPLLEKSVLNQECSSRGNSLRRVKNGTKWRSTEISLEGKCLSNRNSTNLTPSEASPALIAQANWSFVERLLKEVKTKTKRMLLGKLGNEALTLGLSDDNPNIDIEENTLIASLCDLLEKIWSHGLQNKQGKSALWSHLQAYLTLHEKKHSNATIDTNIPSTAVAWNVMRRRMDYLSTFKIDLESPSSPTRNRSRDRNKPIDKELCPLPESLEFDIKNVLALTDIKTQIGYARAWVRLSLEKKLLSRHFRTLLSDQSLIRTLYKRSAFLRCDDEKEQFLYHLLTLNTVDYFCFTNTYPTTKLPYRMVIFPSKKQGIYAVSCNLWISVSGTLAQTQRIPVPKGANEFIFHHKNLGILTTMRIGHDNYGPSNKLLIEHIVIRNEVAGQTYKFPCGRWLGKGIDDDSTERLCIGRLVPRTIDNDELVQVCRTPPRARSPSIHRVEIKPSEIQNNLGDCVNRIVKWHFKPSRERDVGTLTNLLCGEEGLVKCLEQVFLCGFRSSRFFGRNLYIWDFFLKVKEQFEMNLNYYQQSINTIESSNSSTSFKFEYNNIWRCYVHLIDEINSVTNSLGKDDKFQLFICLSLREHLLHNILIPMSETKVVQEMYEDMSFLRRKGLLTFLIQILEPLDEFHIVLENSITQGIPSQC